MVIERVYRMGNETEERGIEGVDSETEGVDSDNEIIWKKKSYLLREKGIA